MSNESKCAVLVPVASHVEPECERGLRQLEMRGYRVWRFFGCPAIDHARNQLASEALAAGFEELIWIDSDIAFDPDSVEQLRSHGLPLTAGIYAKKGQRALACHLLDDTREIRFGPGGGLLEIRYASGGFLHSRREVYETVRQRLGLPACNKRFGAALTPYFLPMLVPDGPETWYLAEDFAFSHRARECGFKIFADTRIRLEHFGKCGYRWEHAGGAGVERHEQYLFRVTKP